MEKQKVISFEKEEGKEYITVGELKKHLDNFDDSLPVVYSHEAGVMPLSAGELSVYSKEDGDLIYIDDDACSEEGIDDYIKVLFLL